MSEEAIPAGVYSEEFTVEERDIDVLGHVNNRVYLRWIETVATNHSAAKGYDAKRYLAMGSVWVAREHWIEYLRPCFLNERVTVCTWIEAVDETRCLRRYVMKKAGKIVLNAATEWDYIHLATMRRTAIPESLRSAFTVFPAADERLKAAGLSRPLRYLPAVGGAGV